MNLDLYNKTYDFICDSILKEHANLLEIGCRPGNITKYLLSKRPDFNIFGIDIATNMIELAKINNPSASFKVMDCRKISQIKYKYDGIVCGFTLPYLSVKDSIQFISNCFHLLDYNGFIYVSFVEGDPDKSGFKVGSSGDRSYFYYYRSDDLINLFTENDFVEINLFKVEYPKTQHSNEIHTVLTAKKKN